MFRKPFFCLCFLAVSVAYGAEYGLNDWIHQLTNTDDSTNARAAAVQIGRMLRSEETTVVSDTQIKLCEAMNSLTNSHAIRRMCTVLSAAPTEEAILIVLNKLRNEPSVQGRAAICDGLGKLLIKHPRLQSSTQELVALQLEVIMRDRYQSLRLIESAEMATAALGNVGFDALMAVAGESKNPKLKNIFYTALGETGDARALAAFRTAIADDKIHEGLRIQAIRAIGQMFARFTREEQTIDSAELSACTQMLYPFLADSVSDQLFAVTLHSFGMMLQADQDAQVYAVVLKALDSESADRREAALDVIYMNKAVWNSDADNRIKWIADFDSEEVCRATAKAVLEKCGGGAGE